EAMALRRGKPSRIEKDVTSGARRAVAPVRRELPERGRSRGKLGSLALGRGARHSFPGGQKRWGRWKSFAAWRLGTIVSLPLGHPPFAGSGKRSGKRTVPPAATQTRPAGEGPTGQSDRVRPSSRRPSSPPQRPHRPPSRGL